MKKQLLLIALAIAPSFAFAQDDPCPLYAEAYTNCDKGITYLNAAAGFDTYSWSPGGDVSDSTIQNPTTTIPGTYTVTASMLIGSELVTNPDFSAGNSGFTSGHTYTTWYSPCNYYVDAIWFGSYFPGLPDHTATTDNMFMHIDGCTTPTLLWEETMGVSSSTTYNFSFWASRSDVARPRFEIHFIGDVTGDVIVSTQDGLVYDPNVGFQWDRYGLACWNSGQNTSVTIQVVNLETAGYGNDFGLDDFSFRESCCATATVTTTPSLGMNLFTNWDFSAGNIGFTSGHTYTTWYSPCNYYVDAIWFGSYFPGLPDHTYTADNMFMHIDGCTTPTMLWEQTVGVQPGTVYNFSFWASDADVAQPKFEIHFIGDVTGDVIVSTQNGIPYDPAYGFRWNEYGVPCWNSGQNTTVTVRIINLETAGYGNDFGLDDFSFRQCCEPDACCRKGDPQGRQASFSEPAEQTFTVFPNPGNGSFQVQLKSAATTATFELMNLLGERIDAAVFSGNTYTYTPEQDLPAGTYVLRITIGDMQYTERIIVE